MSRLAAASRIAMFATAVGLPLLAAEPAAAIDFAPPAPGHKFDYKCSGNIPRPINPARTAEITIKEIADGKVITSFFVNGSPRYEATQSVALYGTSFSEETRTNQGVSRIKSGLEKVPALKDMKVGDTRKTVIEWVDETQKEFGSTEMRARTTKIDVTLAISEESRYRSTAFGIIPVIVLEETWDDGRAEWISKTYLSPEHSAVVAWEMSVGKYYSEECSLIDVWEP
jgi:hypothetical protein